MVDANIDLDGDALSAVQKYLQKMLDNPHGLMLGCRDKLWVFERMGVNTWAQYGSLSQKELQLKFELVPQKRFVVLLY